jgi:hypothetical protein
MLTTFCAESEAVKPVMLKLEYIRSPTVQIRPGFELKKDKLKFAALVPLPVHT